MTPDEIAQHVDAAKAKIESNGTEIVRVVRVLVYEGTRQRLRAQFAASMPDGVKHLGDVRITVITTETSL